MFVFCNSYSLKITFKIKFNRFEKAYTRSGQTAACRLHAPHCVVLCSLWEPFKK